MTKREEVKADATRLGQIILDLKDVAGELIEMSEKYDIPELTKLFNFDATCISNVDHQLVKLAEKLRKKWETDHE